MNLNYYIPSPTCFLLLFQDLFWKWFGRCEVVLEDAKHLISLCEKRHFAQVWNRLRLLRTVQLQYILDNKTITFLQSILYFKKLSRESKPPRHASLANMVTMARPPPLSEIMPKHDEDMDGIGEKYFGGQLGLVRVDSTHQPINSLTAKSCSVGAKLVLFGRYVLNFYVRIVLWILRETKTWRATIFLATQRTNCQILTSLKRYDFDPLLTSSVLQTSYELRATAAKMRSLRVQHAIKLCERIKIWQETTVPQSLLKVGAHERQ